MMCPVKSRNGNNLRAKKQSCPLCSVFYLDLQEEAANEMKLEMNLAFCVLVVLTGSWQTKGQSSALPPVLTLAVLPSPAGTSPSPDPTNEVPPQTHNPSDEDDTSTETTTITKTEGPVRSETATNAAYETTNSAVTTSQPVTVPVTTTDTPSPSAAAGNLSSAPTAQGTSPPRHPWTTEDSSSPLTTFSSPPAHTVQETGSTAHVSTTEPQSESMTTATAQPTTTGLSLTLAPAQDPARPTHQVDPSELNVGDEDLKGPRSSSPLDPLLAGLLSVFIVTTAIVFVILFLKFRQRTNHPEFHRLQDLPMDDLMEDTPLSRYTY